MKQGNLTMKNIFQAIRHWQRGSMAAKMLNRLDDRMLADIGITRGDTEIWVGKTQFLRVIDRIAPALTARILR